MQFLLISMILILVGTFSISPVFAAKKFVAKSTVAAVGKSGGGGGKIPVSVKYRADKKALNFSFSNFTGLSSVSYIFQYETNGNSQGAAGSISSANSPTQSRELLFGTCSTSVCTYHTGLKNAKITFTAKYTNGKTATKVSKIKTYF